MRRAFVLFALLHATTACRAKPAAPVVDLGEIERLREEQKALAARVEALQARLDARPSEPLAVVPSAVPLPRPMLTNDGIATVAPAPSVTLAPTPTVPAELPPSMPSSGALRTEDLHGTAPTASAAAAQGSTIADAEGAVLLKQLDSEMQKVKQNQADQAAALEALEHMK